LMAYVFDAIVEVVDEFPVVAGVLLHKSYVAVCVAHSVDDVISAALCALCSFEQDIECASNISERISDLTALPVASIMG
jgi:hypothetical protein